MQRQARPELTNANEDRFLRKARVLMDLFGPDGVQRIRRAGVPEGLSTAFDKLVRSEDCAETDRSMQTNLIDRFRNLGSPPSDRSGSENEAASDQPPVLSKPAALLEQISQHLAQDKLDGEHPAVIALILRSQPRDVQTRVLKALPGSVARAVIRYLRD